jgi:hypothetical protein
MSQRRVHHVIAHKVSDPGVIEFVFDVLIWTGCIGALTAGGPVYISDCGFKRSFLRSLMQGEDKYIVFHPTLAAIFTRPAAAPAPTSAT